MKISSRLPQFKNKNTLLVVLGKQNGIIYRAANGVIDQIAEIIEEPRHYSDNEGMYTVGSGKGTPIRGGMTHIEKVRDEMELSFIRKVSEELKKHCQSNTVTDIYLFVPSYTQGELMQKLPSNVQDLVRHEFLGNFVKERPPKILARIKEELSIL